MRRTWTLQSNCNRGELSPLLDARKDLNLFYNGLSNGLNVLSIPQGGVKKRPGTAKIGTLNSSGIGKRFSFNTEQNYTLVFTELRLYIFKDKVLQTGINGGALDYLVSPFTYAQALEFDYIQSADTAILFHPDIITKKLTRTSDTAWAFSDESFINQWQYDFNDATSPVPVNDVQLIVFTNRTEGDTFKLTLDEIQTEEIVYADDSTTAEEAIKNALIRLPNTGNDGIAVVEDPERTYTITFSGASANAWNDLTGSPIVTHDADFKIENTSASHVVGTSRAEDTWSTDRGYPRTGTFHEGRLWIGGSRDLPTTIWGSRVNDFFNFDKGRSLADESISATLDTDQLNAITSLFSNRFLQVFTTGAEFYCPEKPITPESVSFPPQTNVGSKRVRPVALDGVTLFIQETGKTINQFLYVDDYQANETTSISFVSEHLIKNPIQMSIRTGTTGDDANYMFLNNTDGTMSVFNSLRAEDVAGFTRWETAENIADDAKILSTCVTDREIYNVMSRTINGSSVYTLEVETDECYLDGAITLSGVGTTITGLDHLEGETVSAMADGAYMGEFVVQSGSITLPRASVSTRSAGLLYLPDIKTMPLNFQTDNGPSAYKKKRLGHFYVSMFESNGVIVNGQRIHDKTIGVDTFSAPIPYTGIKRRRSLGWSVEAICHITQTTPMPFFIRGIGMEVTV